MSVCELRGLLSPGHLHLAKVNAELGGSGASYFNTGMANNNENISKGQSPRNGHKKPGASPNA